MFIWTLYLNEGMCNDMKYILQSWIVAICAPEQARQVCYEW